jgi:hypothetical protein
VALARLYGTKYGVDPKLLLAIGGHETQWGTTGAGRPSQGGYALGYGVTDSGILSKYAGLRNQYRYGASTLAGWGVHGIGDILAGKASRWATDPAWERGVQGVYGSLGGKLPTGLASAITDAAMGGTPGRPGRPGTKAVYQPARLKNVTSRVFDPGMLAQGIFGALAAGGTPDVANLVGGSYKNVTTQVQVPRRLLKAATKGTPPRPGQPVVVTQVGPGGIRSRGLAEAFYDPLGSWDNNAFGGAIGHHSDHVHLSITNPATMIAAIKKAQQMGLRVGENPYVDHVDPVHVPGSFHYKSFASGWQGKPLGEAIDVSGSPALMAAYYRWATGRR